MTAYILHSKASVISRVIEYKDGTIEFTVSCNSKEAVDFDTIGEAMRVASAINEVLGQAAFTAETTEV